LPALGAERVLDDAVIELALRGGPFPGLDSGLFGAFRFAGGDPEQNRELIERGVLLPWWSEPELRIAFLRPLSALTHALDFAFWPRSPRLMYAHSLVWLGLVIAAAARLYGRLERHTRRAFAASLLFAVSPSFGPAVGWLSSRNTLIASFFGICSITAWVSGARLRALFLLAAGLASGEVAVCALAYIACHTWILDPRTTRARICSLVPVALVTLLWRALHFGCGFGASGSGAYLDPLHDASALLAAAPARLLSGLGAAIGPVSADLIFVGEKDQARASLALAAALALSFGFAVRRAVHCEPVARFWALSALFALVPLCAAPPNDRGLLLVLLGVTPLVSRLVPGLSRQLPPRALALLFVGWHALGAPIALALRAGQIQKLGRRTAESTRVFDTLPELERRTVIVLNPPRDLFASYIQLERAARGVSVARHLYWLSSASSALSVTRIAADTLEVRRPSGYWATPLERLYRRDGTTLHSVLEFAAFDAQIVESTMKDGPSVVRFRFREPLEHESLVFVAWQGDRYELVAPPALGRMLQFERAVLEPLL
jgi:hypothetical protein